MGHGFGLSGCCGSWGSFGSYGLIGLILNLVITAVVIGGVIWLVIWLVRRARANGKATFGAETAARSPREILQVRYAKGELTREEYQEMLADVE